MKDVNLAGTPLEFPVDGEQIVHPMTCSTNYPSNCSDGNACDAGSLDQCDKNSDNKNP